MLCESSVVNCHDLSLQVTNLLRSAEFIFVPFVNPDGYVIRLHLPCSLSLLIVMFFVVMVTFSTAGAMIDCGERIAGKEYCAMVLT